MPSIKVTNTSLPFIQKLVALTVIGHVYTRPKLTVGGKVAYEWHLKRPEMRRLLRAIHLTAKQAQQGLVLEALDLMHRRGKNQWTVLKDYYPRMDQIHREVRALNYRRADGRSGRNHSPDGGCTGTASS